MTPINLKRFPEAIQALRNTQRFFREPDRANMTPQANVTMQDALRELSPPTPDAAQRLVSQAQHMLEQAETHILLQRDLYLDYAQATAHIPQAERENIMRALDHDTRTAAQQSDCSGPPHWLRLTTDQLSQLPPAMRNTIDVLREVNAELTELSADSELRAAALEQWRNRVIIARTARRMLRNESERERIEAAIDEIYATAGRSRRALNLADERALEQLDEALLRISDTADLSGIPHALLPGLTDELNRLVRKHNRQELEAGLLWTPQMRAVLRKSLSALVHGRPALLVGETGGAKTALAEALAKHVSQAPAELVSFHGEINTYQLIGRDRIEASGGMTFSHGPVLRAMVAGAPLILDEVNAAPPEFLKRLNVIMQMRPGDTFFVQEDAQTSIRVRPGFCIIATANEKSARYKGVEVLSAELKNRFGTNVYRIRYPDSEVVLGELPGEGLALAEAAIADEQGSLTVQLPEGQLEALVRAAHTSQKLFTGDYGDAGTDDLVQMLVPIDRLVDGANAPALDDTVLSPRMVVAMLEQVRDNMGRLHLTEVLRDWVTGIERVGDRAVMSRLLDSFVAHDGVTLLGNSTWAAEPVTA